jgi:hypothetical protein
MLPRRYRIEDAGAQHHVMVWALKGVKGLSEEKLYLRNKLKNLTAFPIKLSNHLPIRSARECA